MAQDKKNNRGKGWFGDSAGHAKAGSKGGKARGKNRMNTSLPENQVA